MSDTTVKSYCIICSRPTNHRILTQHVESERDEYARDLIYQIVQCAGCNYISFREICVDLETTYVDETGKKCRVPETVRCYPKFIKNHKKINDTHYFPPMVANVYNEVIHSLQEEAFILASMGLRACVEAVCCDLDIRGRNLEQKINKLAAEGHVSKKNAMRLGNIRFMGNDASQKIVGLGKKDIEIALQIVEHLLLTVYILPHKADSSTKPDQATHEQSAAQNLMAEELHSSGLENEAALLPARQEIHGFLQSDAETTPDESDNVPDENASVDESLHLLTEALPGHTPEDEAAFSRPASDNKEINAAQEHYLLWRLNLGRK